MLLSLPLANTVHISLLNVVHSIYHFYNLSYVKTPPKLRKYTEPHENPMTRVPLIS